jgi:hypothetical protein
MVANITCMVERVSSHVTSLALPPHSGGSRLSLLRLSARSCSRKGRREERRGRREEDEGRTRDEEVGRIGKGGGRRSQQTST